ncbi:hypothetical protein FB639_005659, partial [Coemansia asiatica]
LFPPPSEILGIRLAPENSSKNTEVSTWFQGHILTREEDAVKQYGLVGVPAQSPPTIHGCMISDHDTPTFYDLYITEYLDSEHKVKLCAINVERSGGTGDAVELCLTKESNSLVPSSHSISDLDVKIAHAKRLKFSTTKLLSGEQAKNYLSAFAPSALDKFASVRDDDGDGDDE